MATKIRQGRLQKRKIAECRVGGFDVDQRRVEGCDAAIQAAISISAVRAHRHPVAHRIDRRHRHCRRLEPESENSVRARSVRKSRSVRLLGFPSRVWYDLYGNYCTRIQEIASG